MKILITTDLLKTKIPLCVTCPAMFFKNPLRPSLPAKYVTKTTKNISKSLLFTFTATNSIKGTSVSVHHSGFTEPI